MRVPVSSACANRLLVLFAGAAVLLPSGVRARDSADLRGAKVEVLSAGTAVALEVDGEGANGKRPALLTEWVELGAQQKIEDLLAARRLEIDGGTYSLIYALNADITDLSGLKPGSRLKLPVVGWPAGQSPPERLRLVVDRPLKHELQGEVEAIAGLSRGLERLPASKFGVTEAERTRVVADLAAIERDLRLIGALAVNDLMIVDANFLEDVTRQARVVAEILRQLPGSQAPLSAPDVALLDAVRKDLAVRSAGFVEVKGPGNPPVRYPAAPVEVHTLSSNGEPLRNLRVFYVPPALCGRVAPKAFNNLSTPATATLDEATYIFWAGHSAGASAAVPHRGEVRRQSDGRPVRVDLLIERRSEGEGNAGHKDPCGRS